MIELKNLYKSFGDLQVLSNFNAVFDKQINFIVGASGKGKTTVIRLLLGLETPDSGRVVLPKGARLSAVFQENRLFNNMGIEDNIRYVTDRPIDMKIVEKLGLSQYMSKPVYKLSGGTKRRVAILRALSIEFDILVMDEPFAGLDDAMKKQVIDTIIEYSLGKTVIISTHDKYAIQYVDNDKTIIEVK